MLNGMGITSRLNGLVKDRRRQAGQSSVFVLIFLPIVILSLVFLYKAGKVTSEKMELQNAADAVAYSVALLEARDLNFMAYSNRAMVVNEVALGQAVGLASLPRHWRSIGHYIEFLCGARIEPIAKLMVFPPPLKVVGKAIETTCKTAIRKVVAQLIFIKPGTFLTNTIMDPFVVKPLATVMHLSNEVLSGAQTLYHFGTIAYVVSAIDKINKDNADDARLSPYGLVALLGHLQTFGSLGAITGNPQGKFVRTYSPTKAGDTEGFARFAAVVNHSRDEFTKERGWEFKPLDISLTPGFAFSVNLFVVDFSIALDLDFGISLGISRLGGSELRYVGNKTQGDKFNWSSADTTASDFDFHIIVDLEMCASVLGVGPVCVSIHFGLAIANNKISIDPELGLPFGLGTLALPPGGIHIPFPIDFPIGAGAAQIGKSTLTAAKMRNIPSDGPDTYGRAPSGGGEIAWNWGPTLLPARPSGGPNWSCDFPPVNCTVPIVSLMMPAAKQIIPLYGGLKYTGLKKYSDTTDPESAERQNMMGFEGPNIIIALEKAQDDLFSDSAPDPTGDHFTLTGKAANEVIGAIAKAEVYFKRATDVDHFLRGDGFEERENTFSPYWQARLAPLSHADRVVATLQQQDANFDSTSLTPFTTLGWNLLSWIP